MSFDNVNKKALKSALMDNTDNLHEYRMHPHSGGKTHKPAAPHTQSGEPGIKSVPQAKDAGSEGGQLAEKRLILAPVVIDRDHN